MHNIHTVTDFDLVMLKKPTEAFLYRFLKTRIKCTKVKTMYKYTIQHKDIIGKKANINFTELSDYNSLDYSRKKFEKAD